MLSKPWLCSQCGSPQWDEDSPPEIDEETMTFKASCPGCGEDVGGSIMTMVRRTDVDDAELERLETEERQRHLESHRRVIADGLPFEVYGLTSGWWGYRWINGTGSSEHGLTSVQLVFGNPFGGTSPWAKVETSVGEYPDLEVEGQAVELVHRLWRDGWELEPLKRTIAASRDPYQRRDPLAHWEPLTLSVGGQPTEFRRLHHDGRWAAVGRIGSTVVSLDVHGITANQSRLEPVRDFDPFLQHIPKLA